MDGVFRRAILRKYSPAVYARIEEQLALPDLDGRNCEGLVAYLLGLTSECGLYLSGDIPFTHNSGGVIYGRGLFNKKKDYLVKRMESEVLPPPSEIADATVCIWKKPDCCVGHSSLYLGKICGSQWHVECLPGKPPKLNLLPFIMQPFNLKDKEAYPFEYWHIQPRI